MPKPTRNPITRMRKEAQRVTVEHTTGQRIFGLGPASEGSHSAAAEIDPLGNLLVCARFDDDGCAGGFDADTFCD